MGRANEQTSPPQNSSKKNQVALIVDIMENKGGVPASLVNIQEKKRPCRNAKGKDDLSHNSGSVGSQVEPVRSQ